MPTRFAAVLFDMDGVVADNMPLHRAVWTDFARAQGLSPTEAEIRALDGRRARDIIRSLLGAHLDDETVERLAKQREVMYRERLGSATVHPVAGVEEMLAMLRRHGIPRVLATSAVPGNAKVILDRLGLHEAFDAVVTAADVTHGKPHPEVYLTAASRVGVAAANCLVAEDALPGLAAGRAAGAALLGIATSEDEASLQAAGASWVARDFYDLPRDLLDRLR